MFENKPFFFICKLLEDNFEKDYQSHDQKVRYKNYSIHFTL